MRRTTQRNGNLRFLGISLAAFALAGVLALPSAAAAAESARATQRLFEAIRADDFVAAQAAVSAGADIESPDRWGLRPIDLAVDGGRYRIAHYLLSVRAFRSGAGGKAAPAAVAAKAEVADAPAAPAGKAKGKTAAKAERERAAAVAQAEAKPAPAVVPPAQVASPAAVAWPAGRPNPFDPAQTVVDAQLAQPPHDGADAIAAPATRPLAETAPSVAAVAIGGAEAGGSGDALN